MSRQQSRLGAECKRFAAGTAPPSGRFTCKPSRAAGPSFTTKSEARQMNWNQVEGNWEQFKGKVQSKWGKLTGDDLDVIHGKRKELTGKIQERYGKAQEEVEKEVDEWLRMN
jgi:uncharacterized protein YjbJ (UPF0337 family)